MVNFVCANSWQAYSKNAIVYLLAERHLRYAFAFMPKGVPREDLKACFAISSNFDTESLIMPARTDASSSPVFIAMILPAQAPTAPSSIFCARRRARRPSSPSAQPRGGRAASADSLLWK